MSEYYLGDGLYVKFDGFSIWLRAPREAGDHEVALEPQVWRELIRFVNQTPQCHLFSTRSPVTSREKSYIVSGEEGEDD